MRYPSGFFQVAFLLLALIGVLVKVTPFATAFVQGTTTCIRPRSTLFHPTSSTSCLSSRINVNVNGTSLSSSSSTSTSRKTSEQPPVLESSPPSIDIDIDIPTVSNSDNGSRISNSRSSREGLGNMNNAPSGYLNSLLVLHRHGRTTINSSSNGKNNGKRSRSRSFDPQRKSLLQMNDSLNSLNGVARDNNNNNNNNNNSIGAGNSDSNLSSTAQETTPSNSIHPLLAVGNTKASTTVTQNNMDGNNNIKSDNNNKAYNNNNKDDKKNSQEIIRTIHLRNFHRILEQVKILEKSGMERQQQQQQPHCTNINYTTLLFWRDNTRLWRPVLASGLYATWVAVFAARWIQPPAWTIAQHVLPATPTLIQSLLTPTLWALSLPMLVKWMQRAWLQGTMAHQRRQIQLSILVQVKALARSLYQALDECIQRIPSLQSGDRSSSSSSSWPPRPHPMLVSRSNKSSYSASAQQDVQDMQSAAKQCEDILVAAKCLALVGYHTNPTIVDTMDEELFLATVFSDKDGSNRILAATSTTERMTALLERIRQVTCRLKCRDLPLSHLWEERIMALETNLDLLGMTMTSTTATTPSGENALPISLRRSIRWRWKNARQGLAKRALPMLWMGLFPWVLVCRPAIPPVAVVWSSLLCSIVAVTGVHLLERQPLQWSNDYVMLGSSNSNAVTGASWGRQILDIVQQHMTMPAEPTTSSSGKGGNISGTKKAPSSKKSNEKESPTKKSSNLSSLTSLSRRNDVIASTNADTTTSTSINANTTTTINMDTTLNTTATLANATSNTTNTKTATIMDANTTSPEKDSNEQTEGESWR